MKFSGFFRKRIHVLTAAVTVLALSLLTVFAVKALAASDSGIADENLYALKVSTGSNAGDNIAGFIVWYTTSDGEEDQVFLDIQGSILQDSLNKAKEKSDSSMQVRIDSLEKFGYTLAGLTSSGSSSEITKKALSSNGVDTFLFNTYDTIKTVTRIDVVTNVAGNGMASWNCSSMAVYSVDELTGLDMAGYFSNTFDIQFNGTLMARLKIPGSSCLFQTSKRNSDQVFSILTKDNGGNDKYLLENSGFTSDEQDHTSSYSDFYIRIDLADLYGAGIESYINSPAAKKKISEMYLPETLVLQLAYKDTSGSVMRLTVPVVTSALSYAVEMGAVTTDTTIAEFLGQASSVYLKVRINDFASFYEGANNIQLMYDPVNAASLCGFAELDAAKSTHKAIADEIMSSADSISVTGISVYSADGNNDMTRTDLKLYLDNGTLIKGQLTQSGETASPEMYMITSGSSGQTITPSSSSIFTGFKMTGYTSGRLKPYNASERYLIRLETTNASLAATTSDVTMSLSYKTDADADSVKTADLSLRSLMQDYYGYWEGADGTDVGYELCMDAGGVLYAVVSLDNVYQFTGVTFTLNGSDPWQVEGMTIYRLASDGIGERYCTWKSVTDASGKKSSDRIYFRDFNYKEIMNVESPNADSYEEGVDGLVVDGTNKMYENASVEIYLDTHTNSKHYDFYSDIVDETGEYDNWRDYYYKKMPHSIATQDLGFTDVKYSYTVTVTTGKDTDLADDNGDTGSANFFYFQLVFENGTSGYVQANQQLTSDSFIGNGASSSFVIRTNQDYGDLTAINIIPDDSSTDAQPYDKLKIAQIQVSLLQNDSSGKSSIWQVNTTEDNAWVGIDYVEEAANSNRLTDTSRDASSYVRTYVPDKKSTATQYLVAILTDEAPQCALTSLSMQLVVTLKDGTNTTLPAVNVIESLYAFSGTELVKDKTTDSTISDTSTMFRTGKYDCFIVTAENVKSFDGVYFTVSGKEDTTWTVNSVQIARITKNNGVKIANNEGTGCCDYYMLDGEYQIVTETNSQEENRNVPSGERTNTFYMSFAESELSADEATTEAFYVNRTPESSNDYVNISVYMDQDGTDYSNCSLTGSLSYVLTFERSGKVSPVFNRTTQNGQTVYTCSKLGVANISSLSSVTLKASYGDGSSGTACVEKIIVQQIRNNVVIKTYVFNTYDADVCFTETFTPSTGTSSETTDYQTVTVQFGDDMPEIQTLTAETSDVAVALLYTSTAAGADKEYRSEFIYLTDLGYETLKSKMQVDFTFNEAYVDQIKGIVFAVTGKDITAEVESAAAGTYSLKPGASDNTNAMTNTKSGYACTGWYSMTSEQPVTAGMLTIGAEATESTDSRVIVPVSVTFHTAEATDTNPDTGLDDDAKLSMKIDYLGNDGNSHTMTIDDIREYPIEGNFETGGTATLKFMEQGIKSISSITLRCYDEDDTTSLSWGLASIDISYGDGSTTNDRTVNVNDTVREVTTTPSTDSSGQPVEIKSQDGLTIGVKKVRISVCANTKNPETGTFANIIATSEDTGETKEIMLLEENGYVDFLVSLQDSTKGVTARASLSGDSDATVYLSSLGGSTIRFKPSTTMAATYKVQFISNENSKVIVTMLVTVSDRAVTKTEESQAAATEAEAAEETTSAADKETAASEETAVSSETAASSESESNSEEESSSGAESNSETQSSSEAASSSSETASQSSETKESDGESAESSG